MSSSTSNLKGDGGQNQDSNSTSQASSFANLPADLQINVLSFLAPSSILKIRETCSSLSKASRQLSLWTLLARYHLDKGSLTSLPIAEPDPNLELSKSQDRKLNQEEQASEAVQLLVKSLERVLISNERLEQSWNTRGSEPRKSLSIRAHKDRITCVKLLVAESIWTKDNRLKKRRWLITGSVDGFVKVFDLSELEDHSNQEERGSEEGSSSSQPSTATLSEGNKDSPSTSSNDTSSIQISAGAASLPSLGSPRRVSSKTRIPSKSSRRGKASNLVAEVDTGGDVTSIDAELSEDCRFIKIASGSYYSSSAASVYLLDLEAQPTLLDFRYSLDPPNWCGTQTVSIREDLVAVGTYTGLIHLFNWKTGWRGGIEREERSSTASVKLIGNFIISVTRTGTIEIFSLPTPIIDGGSSESESSDLVPDLEIEQGHEQDLPSMSLLSLTDSISNSTHNTKKSQVVKRKAHLLGRFCINEGNKPLLGISIGDTERRRSRGSAFGKSWERQLEKRLEQISLHDAQLGEKDLDRESSSRNQESQEHIIEPLSIYVLDASGLSHLVLDPKISSTSSERKSGQSSSPSTTDPSVLDFENEKDHFPYVWPPRIQSHQAVRGERAIGISTGSSGHRAIVLTSLGKVPPICSCRSFSSNRESSEAATLVNPLDSQDDSESETSGSSGYGSGNDRFTTSALLIPIKPTKGVGIPTSRSLETRRFSSSELGHQNRDRSSTSSLTSAAVSSRQLPSAGASAPLPSPTPSPSQAQFSSFNSPSPSPSRTDSFSSNSSSLASSSNPAQSSTNNVFNASSSQSVPFSQPSLSSSSRSSSQITSSNLYFNSSSSMQNSTTSFDACVPPSRADIFTEQAFNDSGLICLATARGQIYIADYS